ncbi:TPA: hypothetical protein ANIA_10633 [Aspergillus nidulans FGSC A4]|uniref:Uncharacterized protein n=1 Tax=Emericella nidulans (strain FGSC A4 / ATCC 38163 / CBS 112.46 / NRRL 194 / M139) TaxID=227321 RepID=C8VEV6_EMENI|nr:TPA: hypothetical protein ANIA_10633 [Aspergillus nidulans FGSC A4]
MQVLGYANQLLGQVKVFISK